MKFLHKTFHLPRMGRFNPHGALLDLNYELMYHLYTMQTDSQQPEIKSHILFHNWEATGWTHSKLQQQCRV